MVQQKLIQAEPGERDIAITYDDKYEEVEVNGSMGAVISKLTGEVVRTVELFILPCGHDTSAKKKNPALDFYTKNYTDTIGGSLIYTSANMKNDKNENVKDEDGNIIKEIKRNVPPANAFKYLVASNIPIKSINDNRIIPDYANYVIDNNTTSIVIEDTSNVKANTYGLTSISTFIPLYFYYGYVHPEKVVVLKMRLYNVDKEWGIEEARRYVSNFF